jgi:multimeric flavodoxin WrbA
MNNIHKEDIRIKILGIAGTPIKNGNCQYQLEEALKLAESTGHAVTEFIHLGDYEIKLCIGCDKCLRSC